MTFVNERMVQDTSRENWRPLMELAVREVFQIMLGSDLSLPEQASEPATCEFTAMVGLAGRLCGVLTLRSSARGAAVMTARLLGVDTSDVNEQMWDAIGEVCNMIAGNFKNKLTGIGDHCMLSVPTVITGADYSFHSLADSGSLDVALSLDGLPILVSLEIHS